MLQGEYSLELVTLSVAIAIAAATLGFQVASQASKTNKTFRRQASVFTGSIALGGGIWSMHFIGMLAFQLCTGVSYGLVPTLVSMLPAVFASWFALHYLTKSSIRHSQLFVGALLMGSGIGAMHYIGMAAMEMAPLLRYDITIFLLSIVVAVSLSYLSLWARFKLSQIFSISELRQNLIAGAIMGVAISGMHFTGMAAARFVLPPGFESSNQPAEISNYLALGITIISLVIIFIVSAANLILKYKDISEASTNNERRLRATLNTTVDGILTLKGDGEIVSTNNAIEAILGWSKSDLHENNIDILLPREHKQKIHQAIARYLDCDEHNPLPTGAEILLNNNQGETIPVRLSLGHAALESEDLFIVFISDLRQRYEMEKALRDNEAKFRSLISNIPGIAYRCLDTDRWPMVFVSDAVEQLTGYPASDFLVPNPKRSFHDLIHPKDVQRILNNDLPASRDDQKHYAIEYRLTTADNQQKWMLEYGRCVEGEDGEENYLDGVIMDITDRKQMEQALVAERNNAQAAAEARAAFMANMSHEIRTPMNAIIGFSDLLREDKLSEEQYKFVSTIHQSAHSLLHIINDVLDSAKLEKGEMSLEYRDYSIVELLDAVISTFGLQAQKKDIELSLDFDPSIPDALNGAPERIRQVLLNIVGNAIKFTEQGSVKIQVTNDDSKYLTFAVSDEGIGMSEAQLSAVFDPFVQADASMSRRFGGTGLGTTIAKQLVELMGGEISATSDEGKGSCFTFTVPMTEAKQALLDDANNDVFNLPSLSILVADDVEQNLSLLNILLTKHGHEVTLAQNGQQAYDLMLNQQFDLVLMDVQMPVMDGLTAASKWRQHEKTLGSKRLAIIALTASVLENDRLEAQRAGMDGFANKPVMPAALFAEIADVLGHKSISANAINNNSQSQQVLNINYALELWGTSDSVAKELAALYAIRNQLTSLANKDEQAEVSELLHKFKGMCGNLGLETIYTALTKAENALTPLDADEFDSSLSFVLAEFEKLPHLITKLQQENKQDSQQAKASVLSVDIDAFFRDLRQLLEMLKRSSVDDALIDCMNASVPHLHSHEFETIKNDIDNFDFENAVDKVTSLLKMENQVSHA